MALVKCKECGSEVSTKAKKCPSCGAKAPKKTSLVTWFVLAVIVFVAYAATNTSEHEQKLIANTSSQNQSINTIKREPVKPKWTISESKDEMTGKFSAYAFSPNTFPTKKMDFPYSDVSSRLAVGCNENNEWVYLSFDSAPNLTNTETKNKYNLIRTRIRWDDTLEDISLTQDWGESFIHFRGRSSDIIPKIESSNTVLLELQWYGQSKVYFEYPLTGSSKAIAKIRAKCSAT